MATCTHKRQRDMAAVVALATALMCAVGAPASSCTAAPPPPSTATASDQPWDEGTYVVVRWTADESADQVAAWRVMRSMTDAEIGTAREKLRVAAAAAAFAEALRAGLADGLDRAAALGRAALAAESAAAEAQRQPLPSYVFVDLARPEERELVAQNLEPDVAYTFQVSALGSDGSESEPVTTNVAVPTRQSFLGVRAWFAAMLLGLGVTIAACIVAARGGMRVHVRRIAGLEAIDEAVGRATEMGRPVLFIPGIQDMDNVQTVAGVTILGRVAKVAAEYDANIEVPTARSIVMTACRDVVQSAYYEAGRPEAYNPDHIRYITDEQFGFAAYVAGRMMREKPATCVYMGQFFAESLLLSENGNSIGAIQIAGTAETSQLPFFVAACDYTLIGEELFAASAYLSREPTQLGSLLGQDVNKAFTFALVIIGVALATAGAIGSGAAQAAAEYMASTMLKG